MSHSGETMASEKGINFNLAYGSECPVDALPPNSLGFHDVFGNVQQWAEDDFHALKGFKVHHLYDDFSTLCFDGEHNMILGGSFVSTGDEASIWSRFHFRPHFFQHAGFRLVKSQGNDASSGTMKLSHSQESEQSNKYETQQVLGEYIG